jgi:hypothetical protein
VLLFRRLAQWFIDPRWQLSDRGNPTMTTASGLRITVFQHPEVGWKYCVAWGHRANQAEFFGWYSSADEAKAAALKRWVVLDK